ESGLLSIHGTEDFRDGIMGIFAMRWHRSISGSRVSFYLAWNSQCDSNGCGFQDPSRSCTLSAGVPRRLRQWSLRWAKSERKLIWTPIPEGMIHHPIVFD